MPRLIYIIALIAAMGGLLFGYDTGVISGAILFLRKDFSLNHDQIEIAVSSLLIGCTIGALVTGKLADRWGRKTMILWTALFFGVGALFSAGSIGFTSFVISRVVVGMAIGAISFLTPLYISEIAPPSIRGSLIALNQFFITFGIVASYGANYVLAHWEAWRVMVGIALVPSLVLFFGMLFLPRSPRFLMKQGKAFEAEKTLRQLRGKTFEKKELEEITQVLHQEGKESVRRYPFILILGIGLAVFQQLVGINTVIYYAPLIFEMAGFTSVKSTMLATFGLGVINCVTTVVAILTIDKVGRRPLLLWGTCGLFLSLTVLGAVFYLDHPYKGLGAVAALVLYLISFAMGMGPVFWVMIAEIFPLNVRGQGMSIATFFNWLANFFVAFTFLTLVDLLGAYGTFWLYGFFSLIALLFIFFCVPETKTLSLEAIEEKMGGKPPPF